MYKDELGKGMKKIITLILLVAYCVPFAFMAAYTDATSASMRMYGVMIVAFATLCIIALKTKNVPIIIIGNIISAVSSYVFLLNSGLGPMGEYFKPLTSYQTVVVVSVIAFVFQMIAVMVHKNRSNIC